MPGLRARVSGGMVENGRDGAAQTRAAGLRTRSGGIASIGECHVDRTRSGRIRYSVARVVDAVVFTAIRTAVKLGDAAAARRGVRLVF